MTLFDWFRGRKNDEVIDELPWERHPSIFEHIKAHIRAGKYGLCEGGETLPDEDRVNEGSQIRWAAGARDSVADDYEDGAEAVERFLAHVEQCGTSLTQFLTLVAIKNFLADEKADWGVRAERGWSVDVRQNLVKQASAIIDRPVWREKALSGLKQSNELIFHEANTAAAALGIETWPFHWDRLRNSPKDSGRWFHAMSHCDADHIGDVVALAERELPLAAIASGPADELGLGPEFANHTRLDFILQEMGRFPGLGAKLIAAGLRSPVVRNRNMALSALSKWGRDNWPHGIDALLQAARAAEPCEQVKSRIENVIAGKPLE